MAKVTRSTSGAKFLANKDKFDATQFAEFNVNKRAVVAELCDEAEIS